MNDEKMSLGIDLAVDGRMPGLMHHIACRDGCVCKSDERVSDLIPGELDNLKP